MDDVIGGIRHSITRRNRVDGVRPAVDRSKKTPEKPRGWCETSGVEVKTPGRYRDSLRSDSRYVQTLCIINDSIHLFCHMIHPDQDADHLAKEVD